MARKRRPTISGGGEERNYGGLFAVIIALVLIAAAAYTLLSGGGPPEQPPAQALLAQASVAVADTSKESFTFEGAIEVDSPGESMALPFSGEGRIDSVNRRMNFRWNLEPVMSGGTALGEGVSIETYTVGDTVYMNFAGRWVKYNASDELWGNLRLSQKLVDAAGAFNPAVGKHETVNGKEAIRVDVNPAVEDLARLLEGVDPNIAEAAGITHLESLGAGIESMAMKLWIDADEYLPVRASLQADISTKSLDLEGAGAEDADFALDLTLNFDYDTPFNIVLPSAAQGAEELEL